MEVGSIPTGGTSFNSVADQLAVVKHEGDSQLASVSLALRYRRHSSSILVR